MTGISLFDFFTKSSSKDKLFPYQIYLLNISKIIAMGDKPISINYKYYSYWQSKLKIMKMYWMLGEATQMWSFEYCSLSERKPIIIFDEFIEKRV